MFIMFMLSAGIVIPIVHFNLQHVTIDMTTPLILGTAISIFLGFRTNSSYDRWFAARGYWGEINANARNMALVIARLDPSYVNNNTGKPSPEAPVIMERLTRRLLAWVWVLNRQLKGHSPLQDIDHFLDLEELEQLAHAHNPALKLLFNQSRDIRRALAKGQFGDADAFEIVGIQRELIALQSRCEGLKATPFPTHYTFFTDVFVWLLVILLSLSLPEVENSGYFAIPMVVLIGWIFTMVEGIGGYMDDPFADNRNVIPMDSLSRNLEIDLLAFALGETELPETIKPIEGALY